MFTVTLKRKFKFNEIDLTAEDKSKFFPLVNNSGKTIIDNCIIKNIDGEINININHIKHYLISIILIKV